MWRHAARLRRPAVAGWLTGVMPPWLVAAMRPRRAHPDIVGPGDLWFCHVGRFQDLGPADGRHQHRAHAPLQPAAPVS